MAINAPIFNTLVSGDVSGLTTNLVEVTKFNTKNEKRDPFKVLEFPTVKDARSGKAVTLTTEDVYAILSDMDSAALVPDGQEVTEKQIQAKQATIIKDSVLRAVCYAGNEVDGESPSMMAVRFGNELAAFLMEHDDREENTDPKRKVKQISKLLLTLAGTGEIPVDLSSITKQELQDAYAMAVKTEATNGRYTEGTNKGLIKQVLKGKAQEAVRLVNGEPVQA